LKTFDSE